MAYDSNILVRAWLTHTGGSTHSMNGVYGTMVGSTVLRDFINNGLSQARVPVENFQRPSGFEEGGACAGPNGSSGKPTSAVSVFSGPELFLPGTKDLCPTPSPSASPTPTLSLTPSVLPSILPSILPSASPTPTPAGSATPPAAGG